jgi:radical SAM-linked protein
VRFCFEKSGELRLLSHHDLIRTFERMLRRAALPVRTTQGFHPKPRLVFALSLPLGVVGRAEVAELELTEPLEAEEVGDQLRQQAPPGLRIFAVRSVPPRSQAQVARLVYRLALPRGRQDETQARMDALLAAPECWVDRTRPPARRVNIRPYLHDLRLCETAAAVGAASPHGEASASPSSETIFLEMDLRLTPAGTARPDELLAALGLSDLLEAGAVLERVRLHLHDEEDGDPAATRNAAAASTPSERNP